MKKVILWTLFVLALSSCEKSELSFSSVANENARKPAPATEYSILYDIPHGEPYQWSTLVIKRTNASPSTVTSVINFTDAAGVQRTITKNLLFTNILITANNTSTADYTATYAGIGISDRVGTDVYPVKNGSMIYVNDSPGYKISFPRK